MHARSLLLIALLTALTACGDKRNAPAADRVMMSEAPAPAAEPPLPPTKVDFYKRAGGADKKASDAHVGDSLTTSSTTAQLTSSSATYVDGERKFIRTASASFLVKDVYQSSLAIEDAAASLGGFVTRNEIGAEVQQTQRHPGHDGMVIELAQYTVQGRLEIRVPSQKTQEFLRAVVGQVVFLDKRSFAARDAQFDLLRQQLEAKRNEETQLDLQQVSKEGGKLAQKAEVIETRNQTKADRDAARVAHKEFEDQIAFSTISLTIYQLPAIRATERQDIDEVFRQNRPSFFVRMGDALHAGLDHLSDTVVWFAEGWAFWLVAIAVIAGVRSKRMRRTLARATNIVKN